MRKRAAALPDEREAIRKIERKNNYKRNLRLGIISLVDWDDFMTRRRQQIRFDRLTSDKSDIITNEADRWSESGSCSMTAAAAPIFSHTFILLTLPVLHPQTP